MTTRHQRITWTGLPNGMYQDSGGHKFLRVSVHVAPRLSSTAPMEHLGNYPDFLHWPSLVNSMHFGVSFNGGTPIPAQLDTKSPFFLNKPRPQADLATYQELFVSTTPVSPYAFTDFSNRFVISHPASQLLNYLQTAYQYIGSQAGQDLGSGLPSIYHIAQKLNPSAVGTNFTYGPFDFSDTLFQRPRKGPGKSQYLTILENKYAQQGAVPTSFTPLQPGQLADYNTTQDEFQKVRFFHYRDGTLVDPTKPGQKPHQTDPDFHQALSSFTKHPTLERYLGFVIDLLVPFSAAIPQTGNPPGSDAHLQVSTNWVSSPYHSAGDAPIRTRVHYICDGSVFYARPNPSGAELEGRFLNLTDGAYTLSQIDVDGSALKLSNLIATTSQSIFMRSRYHKQTEAIPSRAGLPSLRTTGFQLLKQDRAVDLANAFKQNKVMENQVKAFTDPDAYAEDVTLGYRPDVFDTITGTWHSLMRREGTYKFLNSPGKTIVIDEEGILSLAVTDDPSDPTPDSTKPLYMHETLFGWKGWSLAVPLPGDPAKTGDDPPPSPPGPGANFKMTVDWTNGGSYSSYKKLMLPRLRFGQGYQVRMRAVDLAGNSLDPADPSSSLAIPATPEPYYRWEPVATPPLALADDIKKSPAEHLERFIIRSDYGVNAAGYPAAVSGYGLSYYGTGAGTTLDFLPTSERHVFPPKSSEEMSERLGMFDDTSVAATVKLLEADYDNINGSGKGIVSLDGALPQDATTGQGTVIPFTGNENDINVGYLPDVLARGATIASLPGDTRVPFDPSGYPQPYLTFTGWPFEKPFLLRLNGLANPNPLTNASPPTYAPVPTQASSWDTTHRVLDIYLAQGETWTMQLSSFFNNTDLDLFGIWKWLTDYFNAVDGSVPSWALDQATYGLLWLLSPFRTITLMHPVQRPLVIPQWNTLLAVKETIGQTWADLFNLDFTNPATIGNPPVPVHGKSTIKLDVYGDWKMPIDDGKNPKGFFTITSHDHVVNAPVAPADTFVTFPTTPDPSNPLRQHKFHDTKYRLVDYTAVATTRFKEYFGFSDADITSNPKASITQTSTPAIDHVQNSKRPDAPKVLYVVPAFQWDPTSSPSTNQLESDRHGGWVRVWMDRPWYSSGDGEQLGVIVMALHDTNTTAAKHLAQSKSTTARVIRALGVGPKLVPVPPSLKSYVTQWGTDLTRPGATMKGSPVADFFPKANFVNPDTPTGSDPHNLSNVKFDNLSIAEVNGAFVAVAPHDVHFDGDVTDPHGNVTHVGRKLWYCDIQMNFGESYYPFVRLALARFQPRSLDDTHLSKIIQADFVQLAPNRFATISYQYGGNPKAVHVAVTGPAYLNALGGGPGTTMEVILEQQQANAEGDLAWVPVPHGVYAMGGSTTNTADEYLWQTGVNGAPDISLPRAQGQIPYRLIIKEYESFVGEDNGTVGTVGGQGASIVTRVVYVASVDI